ncbi:SDR family NAD(P)-dependent oxidoreductase [Streptomyces gamaensis]|uniref:SDR family NAD(P)-dependent oxidoreductase n=1 Tax=Streptomyces gamaensis TaxID=1763542 RepID=A0ABW0Z3X0_9ACTN
MGKLEGRVVLITGAARGMGEQEARLFAAEGARVVLADVLDEQGEDVAKDIGAAALYVHLDVGEEAQWTAAVERALDAFGRLDGLVNNAGLLRQNTLLDTSTAEFVEVCRVNQLGTFLGMRTAAPLIADAGGGTIVNAASYAALSALERLTAYAASKAAVLGMTRVAALELGARGIRVNAMCPGVVDTPMLGGARGPEAAELYRRMLPLGRIGQPQEVARLALFLTSEDSSYVTGQPFVVDGGWRAGSMLRP